MKKIVLGSASERRRNILKEMGYDFEVMTADIDEKAIRNRNPQQLTLDLANAKADALIAKGIGDCLLITADIVAVFKDKIIEKPLTKDEAYSVLKGYGSDPIQTVCAVAVTDTKSGKRISGVDISTVHFNSIPDENIREFVESGKVFEHAGAFAAENPLFTPYIKKIEGTLHSIAGLPVQLTDRLIKEMLQ